jgi:hypothetical protein
MPCGKNTMNKYSFASFYIKNLLWIAFFIAVTIAFIIIGLVIFDDFVRGNPHRTKMDTMLTMSVMPLLFSIIALIGTFLVLSLPMLFQGVLNLTLYKKIGENAHLFTFLAIPIVALLTWYCYDYLTPSDMNLGINEGEDWRPYQHGITFNRYIITLCIQTPRV